MKRRSPEEIIGLLREAESSGQTIGEFCRQKGITDKTYYRWRKQYGHRQVAEAKRLKSLEAENAQFNGGACCST